MTRRKKARRRVQARETIKLKAPPGCGPFKRAGRRYVPSSTGFVDVPLDLVEDLRAHGFAPLTDDGETTVATGGQTSTRRERKHGDR